jgi:Protein of unknown function (DUF1579)
MRIRGVWFLGMLFATFVFGSRPLGSQVAAHPPNNAGAGANAAGVRDPTREEASLAKREGDYVTSTKLLMQEGQPEFAGTASLAMILNGRFLREETFTDAYGAYSAVRFFGYDHLNNEYQAVSMDMHSHRMHRMAGKNSEDGKTVTYSGWLEMSDFGPPNYGGLTIHQDHFTVTSWVRGQSGRNSGQRNDVHAEEMR